MNLTESDVQQRVKEVVIETLCVEEDEVTLDARLTDDLGAESIDYLDLVFRLEKAFGIKIDRDEMSVGDAVNEEYVQDDRITDAGMEALRERFPYAEVDVLDETRSIADFPRIFTVETFVKIVAEKLAEQAA
jgi:acyl carrier protein